MELISTAHTNYGAYPTTGIPGYFAGKSSNFLRAHIHDLAYPCRMIWSDIGELRKARVMRRRVKEGAHNAL
jgi:hypothetical protein